MTMKMIVSDLIQYKTNMEDGCPSTKVIRLENMHSYCCE